LPVILRSNYSPFIHFQEPQRGAAFNARFRKYCGLVRSFSFDKFTPVLTGALAVSFATVGCQALAQQTQPGQSVELEAIVISGEGEGYNTLVSDSPKQTAPLLNTPQTINVIPQQVIREQGARNLTEARRCRELLEQAQWADGRRTAGHIAARAKDNEQLADDDPLAVELGSLILDRLGASSRFVASASPVHRNGCGAISPLCCSSAIPISMTAAT